MERLRDTMGALPAILVTTAAVTVASVLTGVLGLWPGGTAEDSTTPVLAPQTGVVDPYSVSARSAPARDVVVDLLGETPRWGAVVPVGFGCALAAPILSAEAGGVSVHVFGPGLGGAVSEQVAACGSRARVADTAAIVIDTDSGRVTAWVRGDVLVTLSTAGAAGDAATTLDERLVAALDGVCADLAPRREDARRNPTQAGYAQHTETVTVTVPPLDGAPDVGPAAASPAGPEPTRTTMPAGVAGPALPTEIERPVAPQWPGAQPLQVDVEVPVVDTTGPGCGWQFTGAVAPEVDESALRDQAVELTAGARAQLLIEQQAWSAAAAAYMPALQAYTSAVADWDLHREQVAAVVASWTQQATALSDYQVALRAHDQAAAALQAYLSEHAAAKTAYDQALAGCQTQGVAPEPGARPGRSCVNPPVRPAILDQTPPTVPVVPTPPVLWKPGDPVPGPERERAQPAHS